MTQFVCHLVMLEGFHCF